MRVPLRKREHRRCVLHGYGKAPLLLPLWFLATSSDDVLAITEDFSRL
jgi:hypothetical protein